MENKNNYSDSLGLLLTLSFSGGLMDAYSFIGRNHVFSNAQTGNFILLGIKLFSGDFKSILNYLLPILFFSQGIIISVILKKIIKKNLLIYEIIILFVEIILISSVALISDEKHLIATSILSLACGEQLQTFRKYHNINLATTMCIGNMRAGIENLTNSVIDKNIHTFKKSIFYFLIIFVFVLGAIVGNFAYIKFKHYAILFSSLTLLLSEIYLIYLYIKSKNT